MLNPYPLLTESETLSSYNAGLRTLSAMAITKETDRLFGVYSKLCGAVNEVHLRCLYLYLYAYESWCWEGDNPWLTEEQLLAVVGRIEELQKEFCDYRIGSAETGLVLTPIPGPGSTAGTPATPAATFILEFNVSAGQNGLSEITNENFRNVRVSVVRGLLTLPGIPQAGGEMYFLKTTSSPIVWFSTPLVEGEYIKITTIPV